MQNLTVKEAIEILLKFPQDAYIKNVSDIYLRGRYEVELDVEDFSYHRGYSHGKSDAYNEMYRP